MTAPITPVEYVAPPDPVSQESLPPLPSDEAELLVYANRLLFQLGTVESERAANAAAEKIQVESLKQRYREVDEPLARRWTSLEAELARVFSALPLRGNAKSRKLAFGIMGSRTVPERVDVTDEAALREDAQGWDPDLASHVFRPMPPRLDHRALVTLVKSKGSVPPGCTVIPAREQFYATPDATAPTE